MHPRHTRLAATSAFRKLGARLAVLGLILVVLNPSAPAETLPADPLRVRILEVRTEGTGSLRLTFIAPPGSELALLRGDRVDAIDTEILNTRVDATGEGTLTYAPGAPGTPVFLRLRASPWTNLETSSPAPEETSVALTRETRLRFSQALAPASVLGTNHLFATFGGRRLLSRVELGADRQTATLFYLEPLPAGARIEVTWDATGLRDHLGRELDSDADGTPGGTVVWNFETVSVTPVFGTSVVGRVFASDPLEDGRGGVTNRPLAGVTISVDGAEETLRTLTAPDGSFTLAPCPAGAFFVTVDGRTAAESAWPNGAYYPIVSKLWDAVPGATNQVNDTGEIFLPRIGAGALVPISTTAETEIRFPAEVLRQNPALEGVSLRVPPNALYSDAGLRGGRVGMAAVAPDRLPEPLPPGLELPLVITIQTDGPQNFSLPVPVRFPNLPDPATGLLASPGSKSALWSFNHDTGHWEIQGPMTVTADGRFVETDPGVGVRQPGWHGVRSGTQTDGAKPWFCGSADFNPSNFAEPCQRSGSAIACGVLGDTWSKWARCGSSFLPGTAIKQAAECATSLTRTVVDLFDRSVKTRDDIAAANDDRGTDVLRVFTLAAKVITTGTLTTLDCVKDLAASQTVDRFLNCGSAFTASLNSVCDQLVNPVGCNQSSTLAGACAGVDALDRGFGVAGALRTGEGFRNAKELGEKVTAGFEALDGLVDLASNLVGADALALASPSGSETESEARARSLALAAFWQRAPAAERARMLALMDQIVATLRELRTLAPRLEQLMHSTADLSLRSQDMALRMGRLAHDFGFATEGPVYYALESGGRVQRGLSHGTLRLILAPSTDYVLHLYQPQQGLYGRTLGLTAAAGFVTTIPGVPMAVLEGVDTDGDALADDAEFVIGTSASARDTDADGAADGAEVLAGANPLDGLAVRTGVLASAPTPSPATALALDATLAVTATSAPGLSFFDLANPLSPVRRSDLPLPAAALDLAFQSGYAAVAAGAQGLLLVDARVANAPRRTHQIVVGSDAVAVTFARGHVVTVFASGEILVVDPASGQARDRHLAGSGGEEVAAVGDLVVVLTSTALRTFRWEVGRLLPLGEIATAGTPASGERGRCLALESGLAVVGDAQGFTSFDLNDPAHPRILGVPPARQARLHQAALNSSGLLLGITSTLGPSTRVLSLYDITNPADVTRFVASLESPGIPGGLALRGGLAYLADGDAGLQVINYLSPGANDAPPRLQLLADSLAQGVIPSTEGQWLDLRVAASDEVSLREVELLADGQRIAQLSSPPFVFRWTVPALAAGRSEAQLRARAIDSAGQSAWSDPILVRWGADTTPPRVERIEPEHGARIGRHLTTVRLTFSEPMEVSSFDSPPVTLSAAGPDGLPATGDDLPLPGLRLAYFEADASVTLESPSPLPAGTYALRIPGSVRNRSGRPLGAEVTAVFRVEPFDDLDLDGLPDALEPAWALAAGQSDTDRDGVSDGDADADADGLSNRQEFAAGTPLLPRLSSNALALGSIDAPGRLDAFAFELQAGDRVLVSVGNVAGNGAPYFRLFGPGATHVGVAQGEYTTQEEFVAAATGTYTLVVGEWGANHLVDYRVSFVRFPGAPGTPGGGDEGTALTSNVAVTGSLPLGDLDAFSLDAAAGDRLLVSVGRTAGQGAPHLRVYGLDGRLMGALAGRYETQIEFIAEVAGPHVVVVGEWGNDHAADYRLTAVRSPATQGAPAAGDEGAALTSNVATLGSLPIGDLDSFTLDATIGDRLLVSVGHTAGQGAPHLRVYGPDGRLMGALAGRYETQVEFIAEVAGPHVVVVGEWGNDHAADYRLTALRVPATHGAPINGDDGGALLSNLAATGSIPIGDLDVYTVDADAGHRLLVSVGRIAGAGVPHLRVYAPDGRLVGALANQYVTQIELTVDRPGRYHVVVGEWGNDHPTDYRVTALVLPFDQEEVAPPSDQGMRLPQGSLLLGSLPVGDIDLFSVTLEEGATFTVNVTRTAGTGLPYLRIYDASGAPMGPTPGRYLTRVDELTAPVAGVYWIAVGEWGNDHSADYQLELY